MMDNLPKRQRMLVFGAGGCVALLILNWLLFAPLGNLWEEHANEIQKLRRSVADGQSTIARGPQTQRVWRDIQAATLPKDPTQAEHDVLSAMDNWRRTSGVELESIKTSWKPGTATIQNGPAMSGATGAGAVAAPMAAFAGFGGPTGTVEAYSTLECRLDVTGTLGNLSRFIFEMEQSSLALRTDSVDLSSRDDTGDRITLSLVVSGLRLAPMEGKR